MVARGDQEGCEAVLGTRFDHSGQFKGSQELGRVRRRGAKLLLQERPQELRGKEGVPSLNL